MLFANTIMNVDGLTPINRPLTSYFYRR